MEYIIMTSVHHIFFFSQKPHRGEKFQIEIVSNITSV